MEFNRFNKVIIETLNKEEAKAFVLFLASEILRHKKDISDALKLTKEVCKRFNLDFIDTDTRVALILDK